VKNCSHKFNIRKKSFVLQIHFQRFLRYDYNNALKRLKKRTFFILCLNKAFIGKIVKALCGKRCVIKIKKSFFI